MIIKLHERRVPDFSYMCLLYALLLPTLSRTKLEVELCQLTAWDLNKDVVSLIIKLFIFFEKREIIKVI